MKRYMAVLAACMVLAAMLAGCRSEGTSPVGTEDPVQTEATQQTEETEGLGATETEATEVTEVTEPTEMSEPTKHDGIAIETKFGNLYYQDQWEDLMQIELIEEDTSVTVVFVAMIDDVRYPLFHLIIGENDGEPAGQITDAQGVKHDVFVYMDEISVTDDLSEGEQNRLFAMQEEINFILENLE